MTDGNFSFLEMNTRLQVEHPVTECTTGVDLVAVQIAVAEGGRLEPVPPPSSGHAIEARLYAEDPAAGWQPHSGTLHAFDVPGAVAEFSVLERAGIRVDSGVVTGSAVGIHYDPLLAKVISYAPTRDEAARALAGSLARSLIHGVVTNRDLLVRVLRHPAFLAGDTDTSFFDRHGLASLAAPLAGDRRDPTFGAGRRSRRRGPQSRRCTGARRCVRAGGAACRARRNTSRTKARPA